VFDNHQLKNWRRERGKNDEKGICDEGGCVRGEREREREREKERKREREKGERV
jgi:hypothetical protein